MSFPHARAFTSFPDWIEKIRDRFRSSHHPKLLTIPTLGPYSKKCAYGSDFSTTLPDVFFYEESKSRIKNMS